MHCGCALVRTPTRVTLAFLFKTIFSQCLCLQCTNRETTGIGRPLLQLLASMLSSRVIVDLGRQLAVCMDGINKGKAAEKPASWFSTFCYQSA